jgi:hypothetical protein
VRRNALQQSRPSRRLVAHPDRSVGSFDQPVGAAPYIPARPSSIRPPGAPAEASMTVLMPPVHSTSELGEVIGRSPSATRGRLADGTVARQPIASIRGRCAPAGLRVTGELGAGPYVAVPLPHRSAAYDG